MTGATAGELVTLTHQLGPFLGAALTAYGAGVLDKSAEVTAKAAVNGMADLGRRIFQALLGKQSGAEKEVTAAVRAALRDPADPDTLDQLLLDIRRVLRAHPDLLGETRRIMSLAATQVTINAVGEKSVAAYSIEGSVIVTGEGQRDRIGE